MKASIRQLRKEIKAIIDAVMRGETVTITNRNKEVAQMIPIRKEKPTESTEVFGMWSDDKRDVKEIIDSLRKGRYQ